MSRRQVSSRARGRHHSAGAPSIRLLPRDRERGRRTCADLALRDDGVILLPDGAPRAILQVDGVTFECRSPAEQDTLSAHFGHLATSLAPGQSVQILIESQPLRAAQVLPAFFGALRPPPGPLREFTRAWEPWLAGQMQRAHVPDLRFFVIVSPVPPRTRRGLSAPGVGQALDRNLAGLEQAVAHVAQQMTRLGLDTRRLGHDPVLELLWRALHPSGTPLPAAHAAQPQDDGPLLSGYRAVLTDQGLLWRKSKAPPRRWARLASTWPRRPPAPPATTRTEGLGARITAVAVRETLEALSIDGQQSRTLFLLAPPEVTDPGWLEPLVSLSCPYRLALHLEGLDRTAERTRLKRRRGQWGVITTGATAHQGQADVDMQSAQAEAGQQATDLLDPHRGLVRAGLYLTLFAPDAGELARRVAHATRVLATHIGAEVGRGTGHQLPLWQSTLPLGRDMARRRYRLRSETIGNAFPFLIHSPGTPRGYPLGFTTAGHELVLLDPGDPSLPNSLMNIVGRSGSGKTFLAQKLALWMLLQGGRATIVDRAGHYETLLALVGGAAARLGAPHPPALNLWDHGGDHGARAPVDATKIGFVLDAHEILLAQNPGERLGGRQRAVLEQGIRAVYARHAAAGSTPREHDLVDWLNGEAVGSDPGERALLRDVAARLGPFVGEGRHAALLDQPTTVDLEAPLLIFDLDGLSPTLHALAMFLVAEAVDRRARRRASVDPATPRLREMLIVDEGWFVVRYAGAGAWIDELARRGRHWGLFLCFITQQLSDLTSDPAAAALFNQASCQLLFRQKDQRGSGDGESGMAWLARALGLSDEEVRRLERLSSVPGEYAEMLLLRESRDHATARRGIVQVIAHPLEYWLMSSEPLHDVPRRQRMIAACGGDVWTALTLLAAGQEPPRQRLALVT